MQKAGSQPLRGLVNTPAGRNLPVSALPLRGRRSQLPAQRGRLCSLLRKREEDPRKPRTAAPCRPPQGSSARPAAGSRHLALTSGHPAQLPVRRLGGHVAFDSHVLPGAAEGQAAPGSPCLVSRYRPPSQPNRVSKLGRAEPTMQAEVVGANAPRGPEGTSRGCRAPDCGPFLQTQPEESCSGPAAT